MRLKVEQDSTENIKVWLEAEQDLTRYVKGQLEVEQDSIGCKGMARSRIGLNWNAKAWLEVEQTKMDRRSLKPNKTQLDVEAQLEAEQTQLEM